MPIGIQVIIYYYIPDFLFFSVCKNDAIVYKDIQCLSLTKAHLLKFLENMKNI